MFIKKIPELQNVLNFYKEKDLPNLYHITTESNAKSILKNGLIVSKMGENHGSMEVQPPQPMIYLSRHPNGNNLPCSLFDSGEKLVSLLIDPTCIVKNDIYPDDGMFAAIGNDDFLTDVEDVLETLDISENDAEELVEATFKLSKDTVTEWKDFACWYLHKEGEISTPHNIDPKFITFSHEV